MPDVCVPCRSPQAVVSGLSPPVLPQTTTSPMVVPMESLPQTTTFAQDCGSVHTTSLPQTTTLPNVVLSLPHTTTVPQACWLRSTVLPHTTTEPQTTTCFHVIVSPPIVVRGDSVVVSQCVPVGADVSAALARLIAPLPLMAPAPSSSVLYSTPAELRTGKAEYCSIALTAFGVSEGWYG